MTTKKLKNISMPKNENKQKPRNRKEKGKQRLSRATSPGRTFKGQQTYGNPVNFKSNWRNLKKKKVKM